jgi:ubiquinone/menaquinone biosynthesis C-methylase UbiE
MQNQPFQHGMTAQRSLDELAREDAVRTMRGHVYAQVSQGTRALFTNVIAPGYAKRTGRPLEDRAEIREIMEEQPYTRLHLSLQRSVQEVMWNTVIEATERQRDELNARAKALTGRAGGSLTLDPDLVLPRYVTEVDIHCMPGGYGTETTTDDVTAGAIYDRGISMYHSGPEGILGLAVIQHVKRHFPNLKPARVLDMGCTIGNSTTHYCSGFPEARIDAIDVSAPCLRYGHARAESLGKPIHFSQQNAERTRFADNTFDLVVSHILAHETSTQAWANILKESYRVLKPGGVMVHADLPQFAQVDPYSQFLFGNETRYNNEPFWTTFRTLDLRQMMRDAGFAADNIDIGIADNPTEGGFTNTKVVGRGARGFGWGVQVGVK